MGSAADADADLGLRGKPAGMAKRKICARACGPGWRSGWWCATRTCDMATRTSAPARPRSGRPAPSRTAASRSRTPAPAHPRVRPGRPADPGDRPRAAGPVAGHRRTCSAAPPAGSVTARGAGRRARPGRTPRRLRAASRRARSSSPPPPGGTCPGRSAASSRVVAGATGWLDWTVPLLLAGLGLARSCATPGGAPRPGASSSAGARSCSPAARAGARRPRHPGPRRRRAAMRTAGAGSAGSPARRSSPRSDRTSRPCCSLLAVFGLLVITATPVAQVPARLRALVAKVTRRTTVDLTEAVGEQDGLPHDEQTARQRRRRRARAPLTRRSRWRWTCRSTPRCSTRRARPAAPQAGEGRCRRGGRRRRDGRPDRGTEPTTDIVPFPGPDTSTVDRGPHRRARGDVAARPAVPGDAARPVRGRDLPPAEHRGPQARRRAQDAQQGQRRDRRVARGRARPVRDRRAGDRLHARADSDPLRGRARPRRQGRAGHRTVQEHRVRGRQRRRADPEPDPGQVGHRHRDPELRPGAGQPRRRAARQGREQRPPPDGGRPRQGRRGRVRRARTWPRCRTSSSPARPAPARAAA